MEHRAAQPLANAAADGTRSARRAGGPQLARHQRGLRPRPHRGSRQDPGPHQRGLSPRPAPAPVRPEPGPAPEPEPAAPAGKRKHRVRRLLARIFKFALAMVVITELAAVSFIWFAPPRTAFMLQTGGPIAYQYVSLNHISRYVIAAAVAHEDQQLGTRVGAFSVDDFRDRAVAYLQGKDDPSGSTVPQQLVKNIFLWPDANALRKGLEAGLRPSSASP